MLRYEKSISDDPIFLISKVQPCPTSSVAESNGASPNRRVQGMRHSTPIFITNIIERCNTQIQNPYTYTTFSDLQASLGMRLLKPPVLMHSCLQYWLIRTLDWPNFTYSPPEIRNKIFLVPMSVHIREIPLPPSRAGHRELRVVRMRSFNHTPILPITSYHRPKRDCFTEARTQPCLTNLYHSQVTYESTTEVAEDIWGWGREG